MPEHVGIWIDHEKAFIVTIIDGQESVEIIKSDIEGKIRLSGGSRSRTIYGPQDVASEKKIEERRKHQLRRYYEKVISEVGDARKILLFGPGEVKISFEKEMKKSKNLSAKIVSVEPADKMTEKQIVAKVRKFFSPAE
jgi:hypothetical protein